MKGYTIGQAAQMAGLSPIVIRAWENRYHAVVPKRSDSGQRRYDDADVERLHRLSRLVSCGHSIGSIVGLDSQHLEHLEQVSFGAPQEDTIQRLFEAIADYDASRMLDLFRMSLEKDGPEIFLDQVVAPLMDEVGRAWHEGRIRTMHEHLASSSLHALLGWRLATSAPPADAPSLAVATLPAQEHNLGALGCALVMNQAGWRSVFIGSHIPPQEMVKAVSLTKAKYLLLSIVFPPKITVIRDYLRELEDWLPLHVNLLVGGSSAPRVFSDYTPQRAQLAPRTLGALREQLALKSLAIESS